MTCSLKSVRFQCILLLDYSLLYVLWFILDNLSANFQPINIIGIIYLPDRDGTTARLIRGKSFLFNVNIIRYTNRLWNAKKKFILNSFYYRTAEIGNVGDTMCLSANYCYSIRLARSSVQYFSTFKPAPNTRHSSNPKYIKNIHEYSANAKQLWFASDFSRSSLQSYKILL